VLTIGSDSEVMPCDVKLLSGQAMDDHRVSLTISIFHLESLSYE